MDWYEIRKFKDNVEALEGFFLEMAANEKRIRAYGLHLALQLDSSKGGLAAIKSFTEDLSRIRRIASYIDRTIGQELESMMGDGLLLQQLPIVALHLRLCEARLASKVRHAVSFTALIRAGMATLLTKDSIFADNKVSLSNITISLARLRGLVTILDDILLGRRLEDNELVTPSNVDVSIVLLDIDSALAALESAHSLTGSQREQISIFLKEAKEELASPRPSWTKILGALVIVATITGGIADAPSAATNIRHAVEYILGASVHKPSTKSISAPSDSGEHAKTLTIRT